RLDDIHFVLSHAHRFDQHDFESRRIEDIYRVPGGPRQTPERAPGRHGANEHAGIGIDLRHANSISENRPARKGRRGIDGDDTDAMSAPPIRLSQPLHERRLARARRPGDTDHPSAARPWKERPKELGTAAFLLDTGDGP